MKPTDPTPSEYVKWIMNFVECYVHDDFNRADNGVLRRSKDAAKFILTELRDNSTTEINRLYLNEFLSRCNEQRIKSAKVKALFKAVQDIENQFEKL